MFKEIYNRTVETFPQAFYFVIAALFVVYLAILAVVNVGLKRAKEDIGREEEEEEEAIEMQNLKKGEEKKQET